MASEARLPPRKLVQPKFHDLRSSESPNSTHRICHEMWDRLLTRALGNARAPVSAAENVIENSGGRCGEVSKQRKVRRYRRRFAGFQSQSGDGADQFQPFAFAVSHTLYTASSAAEARRRRKTGRLFEPQASRIAAARVRALGSEMSVTKLSLYTLRTMRRKFYSITRN